MSLDTMDDFASYGTDKNLLLDGKYASIGGTAGGVGTDGVALVADPAGSGNTVFLMEADSYGGANNASHIRYVLKTADTVVGVAARFYLSRLPNSTNEIPMPIIFRDGSNNPIGGVYIHTTGGIGITSGDWTGTTLASTTGPVLTAGSWYHIEAWYNAGSTSIEVRVEASPVLTATDAALTGTIAQIMLANRPTGGSSCPALYAKDLHVLNNNGSENNDFIGTNLVLSLLPDSDITLDWTPSVGLVGWSILDNSPPTTDNISATAVDQVYEGTLTNLPADITSIAAVMTVVRAGKSDGGDAFLQASIKTGADQLDGVDRPLTVSQTYWEDVFEVSPVTGDPWIVPEVDAAHIKMKRLAS